MCTALADIHTNIPAVPQNDEVTDNHTSVRVTMKDHTVRSCRGGIDINHLLGFLCVELPKYFSTSFLTFLPWYFNYLFRVYWDDARHEMESLTTSWLVDEFQQNLHSKSDYASALEHILMVCPELGQYMTDYQLVLTGDYPTWIFCWLPGSRFTIFFKVVGVVLSKFIETRDSHRNLSQKKYLWCLQLHLGDG